MKMEELQRNVRRLATLEETASPVISCYLNLEAGERGFRDALSRRVRELRQLLSGNELADFEVAYARIEEYLAGQDLSGFKGAGIFSRAGGGELFAPMTFRAPLPNWLAVGRAPNIYHLVELKDTYHRYVVVFTTADKASILEVNLGAVTGQLLAERPELRKRVGREWTREHYVSHRRERNNQFTKEQVRVLERLMSAGGYGHLILAGQPQATAQVRKALPKHLEARLVDSVTASSRDDLSQVVDATLVPFLEQEERESRALVDELIRELRTGGPAVTGEEDCLAAVEAGMADVLIIIADYNGEAREEMARNAERTGCLVEIVSHSDELAHLGGVGAILRHHLYPL